MDQVLQFKTYCFEIYKLSKGLSAKETFELFEKYGVFKYLEIGFKLLSTTGDKYIVSDIDIFIDARK